MMFVGRWGITIACMIAGPVFAGTVRLRESARVADPVVTLGTVADIQVNDPIHRARLEAVEIGAAPVAEETRWIDLVEVKEALSRAGVRVDELSFSGARRVELKRGEDAENRFVRQSGEYWRSEIERLVREQLARESRESTSGEAFAGAGPHEQIEVRVEAERLLAFLKETPTDDWRLVVPGDWQAGWQQGRVEVRVGEQPLIYPVMIHLLPARQVVVPRVPLERGATIEENDVMLVAYEKSLPADDLVTSVADVVGHEVKRNLPAGQPIPSRDVRRPPVVFRGQPVNVHIRYGSAWLQKTFLAAADAGVGEWVEVYEAGGRSNQTHPHQVRVLSPHTAELPMEAPPSRASLQRKVIADSKRIAQRPPTTARGER